MANVKKMEEELQAKLHNPEDKRTDEWYKNYIEKYKNSEFYNELVNNPYLIENNREYSPGFLGDLGEAFGITSGRDAYYEDLLKARNEKLSQIEAQIREQERNEPAAELERRKAAGLNDDLNGGQAIGAGEAAQNDQPIQSPNTMNSVNDTIENGISAIWNVFSNAYSLTTGIMKDIEVIKQAKQKTESDEIGNLTKFLDIAEKAADFTRTLGTGKGDKALGTDTGQKFFPMFRQFFKSEKRYKKFTDAVLTATTNVETQRKNLQQAKGYKEDVIANEIANGEFEEAYAQDEGAFLRDFSRRMWKLRNDLYEAQYKLDLKATQNRDTYESIKDYSIDAALDNETGNANMKKVAVQKILNEFTEKWAKDMERASKQQGWKGTFAQLGLGLLSMQSMQMLPKLSLPSFNFSNHGGKKSFGIGW